jgi:hypothetical protein
MRRLCSSAARCNMLICERCSRHWREAWDREERRLTGSWYERVEVTETKPAVQPKPTVQPKKEPDDPNVN